MTPQTKHPWRAQLGVHEADLVIEHLHEPTQAACECSSSWWRSDLIK